MDGTSTLEEEDIIADYLKGDDVEVNEAALDVNGDGTVNNKDLTRLQRYLKGDDVEIH